MTDVVSVGGEGDHRGHLAGRWRRVLIAGLGIALVLGACAGIYGKKIVFTQDELQAKVATKFPLKKRKSLVTVNFLNPRILLTPGSDRIGISLDMEVSAPGLKSVTGHMEADGGLEYRPDSGEFAFTEGRVRAFELSDIPKAYARTIEQVGAKVVKAYLSDLILYRLKPDNFKHSLAKLVLKSVAVENGEVVVEIGL
jgi:hypothetical protein